MFKQFIKGLLGIKAQEPQPQMGPGEKRLVEVLKLQQDSQERADFIARQREANKKVEAILASMKANSLLPKQIKTLEEEFLIEDQEFQEKFLRLLNEE